MYQYLVQNHQVSFLLSALIGVHVHVWSKYIDISRLGFLVSRQMFDTACNTTQTGRVDAPCAYALLVCVSSLYDNHVRVLSPDPQFEPRMVDLVYDCAKFKYECGNYAEAAEYLYFYRVVVCV